MGSDCAGLGAKSVRHRLPDLPGRVQPGDFCLQPIPRLSLDPAELDRFTYRCLQPGGAGNHRTVLLGHGSTGALSDWQRLGGARGGHFLWLRTHPGWSTGLPPQPVDGGLDPVVDALFDQAHAPGKNPGCRAAGCDHRARLSNPAARRGPGGAVPDYILCRVAVGRAQPVAPQGLRPSVTGGVAYRAACESSNCLRRTGPEPARRGVFDSVAG